MLLTAKIGGKQVDIVGAGQKSGDFTAVDRNTGALLWKKNVGAGRPARRPPVGLRDRRETHLRRRVQLVLRRHARLVVGVFTRNRQLSSGAPSTRAPVSGARASPALAPSPSASRGAWPVSATATRPRGRSSTANGVVDACSLNPIGPNMYAMDAATGAVKWSYASGSSCLGGAAIANGTVYWGTGYRAFAPLSTAGNKLFAFTPNGN